MTSTMGGGRRHLSSTCCSEGRMMVKAICPNEIFLFSLLLPYLYISLYPNDNKIIFSMTKAFTSLLMALFCWTFVSCGGDSGPSSEPKPTPSPTPTPTPTTTSVTGVSIDKTTLTLEVGATANLTAKVAPDNATDKTVTWSSDKTSVATVDDNGKVTAVAAGTASITVKTKDGEKTATCTVTVTEPAPDPEPTPTPDPEPTPTPAPSTAVTSVALTTASMTIEVNDVVQLTATVKPDDATDKTVTWTSDHANIASVDATGKVTAKAAGTATITVTANDGNGVKATCKVTVVAAGSTSHTAGGVTSEGQDW